MSRGGSAWATAGGAIGGLLVGLFGAKYATSGMTDQALRANVVLAASVGGAALGAGITSYATAPKQLGA